MPSVVEIFTVSGVAVGASVASGVEVFGAFKVSEVSEVCDVGAGVELDEGGMAALWQAVSKKMERRSGMIFFMYISLSLRGEMLFPDEAILNWGRLLRRKEQVPSSQ
jgi:hypothetical protein